MANRSGGARNSAKKAKTSFSARAVPGLDGPNLRSMGTRSGGARNAAGKASTSSSDNVTPIVDDPMTTQSMGARSGGARNSAGKAKNSAKAAPQHAKATRSTHARSLGLPRVSHSDSVRKRKAVHDNMESASKKGRMVEPTQGEDNNDDDYEEEEEEESVKKKGDVLGRLLSPLLGHMNQFIHKYPILRDVSWLKGFQERKKNLEGQQGNISKQAKLLKLQDLSLPFGRPQDAQPGQPGQPGVSNISGALVEDLEKLEKLREECIANSKRIPPSQYCRTPIWQQCQGVAGLTIRSGRYRDLSSTSYPIGLELLHSCFRLFTSFMLHPPKHNPAEEPKCDKHYDSDEHYDSDDYYEGDDYKDDRTKVIKCVDMLLLSMPQMFSDHRSRLREFLSALMLIFPDDKDYVWDIEVIVLQDPSNNPSKGKDKVDIVYRNRTTSCPLIFVEIKLEPGAGGDPFWQNARCYQLYLQKHKNLCEDGAPIFLLQLSGMTFTHFNFYIGLCILL
jgi:hypothetical protein